MRFSFAPLFKVIVKGIAFFIAGLFLVFLLLRLWEPGAIFFHKKGFDLVLKDASTGNPISGAIVELDWNKGFGGTWGGWSIKHTYEMTRTDGTVHEPAFWRVFLFTVFDRLYLHVYHPTYTEISGQILERDYPYFE